MKHSTFKHYRIAFLDRLNVLDTKKASHYSVLEKDDRFYHFQRIAEISGHNRIDKAILECMTKHVASLYNMVEDKDSIYRRDVWEEKIGDTINYLLLLLAWKNQDDINERILEIEKEEK